LRINFSEGAGPPLILQHSTELSFSFKIEAGVFFAAAMRAQRGSAHYGRLSTSARSEGLGPPSILQRSSELFFSFESEVGVFFVAAMRAQRGSALYSRLSTSLSHVNQV